MAEHAEAVRETARDIREDMSREKLEDRLDSAISERPILRHAIDIRIFGRAVLIAAVAAALILVLTSRQLAAIVLLLAFFASWAALSARSYGRRRKTVPADHDD
jgi:hypothetical protein